MLQKLKVLQELEVLLVHRVLRVHDGPQQLKVLHDTKEPMDQQEQLELVGLQERRVQQQLKVSWISRCHWISSHWITRCHWYSRCYLSRKCHKFSRCYLFSRKHSSTTSCWF